MSKKIETLVEDVHKVQRGELKPSPKVAKKLAKEFAKRMEEFALNRVLDKKEYTPALRMSNIGKPCARQLWLEVNKPEMAEVFQASTYGKFNFGDMTEEYILLLVEAAGHKVEGRQDEMEVEGVKGHRDCVIDGVLVDVKSASSYGFKKFKEGNLVNDDPFGYVGQIQTYLEAAQDDPLVTDKDRCAFLVFDKALGHIHLDIHRKVDFDVAEITRRRKAMVESDEMPDRAFDPEPDGYWKGTGANREFVPNGNMKLGTQCSYCPMKYACYPELKTYIYANKAPLHLTKIVKEPNVPLAEPELVGD